MRCVSITATQLLLISTTLCASDKPDASEQGTLSQDHTDEPVFYAGDAIQIGVLKWKAKGDMRAGWVQYDYNNPPVYNTTPYKSGDPAINKGHTDSKGF